MEAELHSVKQACPPGHEAVLANFCRTIRDEWQSIGENWPSSPSTTHKDILRVFTKLCEDLQDTTAGTPEVLLVSLGIPLHCLFVYRYHS